MKFCGRYLHRPVKVLNDLISQDKGFNMWFLRSHGI